MWPMPSAPRARKSLGQHFLADENIARKMVSALTRCWPRGAVLEVGGGTGALTGPLLEAGYSVHVVDVDERMIAVLKRKYPSLKASIIHGDFLKYDISAIGHPVAVVGNFPYHIASQILFRVLEFRGAVPCVVGMFQKEMARRITATHGNKEYGILTVMMQAFYELEYLFDVSASCFVPPPKVTSAVVAMRRIEAPNVVDERRLLRLLKSAFGQRRKQLRNSLHKLLPAFDATHPPEWLFRRAEQLSVAEWVTLANRWPEES